MSNNTSTGNMRGWQQVMSSNTSTGNMRGWLQVYKV